MPGTIMKVEGADAGGAPIVSAVLPSGRFVRGVTLNDMIERFIPKSPPPAKAMQKMRPQSPSTVAKAATSQDQDASPGKIAMPAIKNSPDLLCEQTRPCTDEEFSARLAQFEKRWTLMPDSVREPCLASSTLPAMEQCTAGQTTAWVHAHPDKETPWMDPELMTQ